MPAGRMWRITKKGRRNAYAKKGKGYSGYKRKKKSYTSKLLDKKINTIYEKRAKEIAQKEVIKSLEYYIVRGNFYDQTIGSYNVNTDLQIPLNLCYSLIAGNLWQREFVKVGGYLTTDTDPDEEKAQEDPIKSVRDMSIHIKNIKLKLRFFNQTLTDAKVQIHVMRVPYNKQILSADLNPNSSENPQPQIFDLKPLSDYHGITTETTDAWRFKDLNQVKHGIETVLKKEIIIPVQRVIRGEPYLDTSTNPPANRSRVIATENFTNITMAKTYAGRGYKELYKVRPQIGPAYTKGSLSDHRYFINVRSDINIRFSLISAVRFCKGKAVPNSLVFDAVANIV